MCPAAPGGPLPPHSSSSSPGFTDHEAIQELQSSLKETRRKASGTALYYAGLFLWLVGHHDEARDYIDRMLKVSTSSREVLATCVMGAAPARPHGVALTPTEDPGPGRALPRR